jgi:hypothetical protein
MEDAEGRSVDDARGERDKVTPYKYRKNTYVVTSRHMWELASEVESHSSSSLIYSTYWQDSFPCL